MDEKALVADFKKLLKRLQQEVGPVALLMLISEGPGAHWEVRVSAKGFDEMMYGEAARRFVHLLWEYVEEKNRMTVGRILILKTDDLFVRVVHGTFGARASASDIVSGRVLDVEIPLAIILKSAKIAA
jgi:hypothetical protein